jgi:hypothetical protein
MLTGIHETSRWSTTFESHGKVVFDRVLADRNRFAPFGMVFRCGFVSYLEASIEILKDQHERIFAAEPVVNVKVTTPDTLFGLPLYWTDELAKLCAAHPLVSFCS